MKGAFVLLCLSTALEFFSTLLVYRLFTRVKAKEIENLRWISTIGNNKTLVNKKYIYKMPEYMTKEDPFKKELQSKINYLSKHDPEDYVANKQKSDNPEKEEIPNKNSMNFQT